VLKDVSGPGIGIPTSHMGSYRRCFEITAVEASRLWIQLMWVKGSSAERRIQGIIDIIALDAETAFNVLSVSVLCACTLST